jgi:predicted RNA-binding protein
MSDASSCLLNDSYVTTIKSEHLRSHADPGATDEIVISAQDKPFDCAVNQLIDFYIGVLEEKENVALAISKAKASAGVDIDGAVAMNKSRQNAAAVMAEMANVKSKEYDSSGRGYRINNEGNQTAYVYKIKEVITIDFDRKKVKAISKSLLRKSDEVSAEVDRLLLSVEVDHNALFDVNDKFEDALEAYLSRSVKP